MNGESLADLRIRVEPGPGVVAALDDVLLVVPSFDADQVAALDALLAAVDAMTIERAVARVVADFDEDRVPPFCLVAEGEQGGLFALVHGEVVLSASGSDGGVHLSGREARTWVDRALPGGLERLMIWPSGGPEPTDDPRLDLRTGIVRGSGVYLTPRRSRATDQDEVAAPVAASAALSSDTPVHDTPSLGITADPEPADAERVSAVAVSEVAAVPAEEPVVEELAAEEPVAEEPVAEEPVVEEPVVEEPVAEEPAAVEPVAEVPAPEPVAVAPIWLGPPPGSTTGFRPEPIRFGDGGRIEPIEPIDEPPATVNGFHGDRDQEAVGHDIHEHDVHAHDVDEHDVHEHDVDEHDEHEAIDQGEHTDQDEQRDVRPEPVEAVEARGPVPPPLPPPLPAPPADQPVGAGFAPPTGPLGAGSSVPSFAQTQLVGPPPLPMQHSGLVPPPVPAAFDPFGAPEPSPPVPPSEPPHDLPAHDLPPHDLPPTSANLLSEPATPRGGQSIQGRLVIDNRPDVLVSQNCVIGRNPEVDPDVAAGRAVGVTLPDAEQRISRVHARLLVGERGVEIVDVGSVNGTWIEPPGAGGWIAMVPKVPAELPLGSRIQVGDIVLAYAPAEG